MRVAIQREVEQTGVGTSDSIPRCLQRVVLSPPKVSPIGATNTPGSCERFQGRLQPGVSRAANRFTAEADLHRALLDKLQGVPDRTRPGLLL